MSVGHAAAVPRRHTGIWSWIFTVDHKKIGILYGATSIIFFLLGGLAALAVRTKLAVPGPVKFMSPDTYNEMFTMHGTIMVWWFVIPFLTGAFGNYLLPIMIGARDMAFPRMNALSYWLFLLSGIILISSAFVGQMPDDGWTSYPPYSIQSPGLGMDLWILALHVLGISTVLGAINFIVTTFNMRAPGMTFNRLPLFVWGQLVTAFMNLLSPVSLAAAITTLLADRHWGTVFYDVSAGGDPMLYQHLFWFYSHPAVYIMMLPAMGIVSEIIPVFSRKPIFGYHAVAYSSVAIGFLGFFVWAHHMFTAGMYMSAGIPFMITSMIIAVPSAIKVFNWLSTMWRGSVVYTAPMLFVTLGFLAMFTIGGLSGIFVASVPVDFDVHNSYFVVAHFHMVLFGGSLLAAIGGLFYWYPKVFGRMYNEKLALWTFWSYFVGTLLTFFPMHFVGLAGMARRYYEYNPSLQPLNVIETAGSYLLGAASLLLVYNLVVSAYKGQKVGANPWGDPQTLEWTIPSPPPEYNFETIPTVTATPYEFGEEPLREVSNR